MRLGLGGGKSFVRGVVRFVEVQAPGRGLEVKYLNALQCRKNYPKTISLHFQFFAIAKLSLNFNYNFSTRFEMV